MTKEEARAELLKGNKVSCRNFREGSYMELVEGAIRDQDGMKIPEHFWIVHSNYYHGGWKLVEKIA